MVFCAACGHQMHEAAASCPSCGRPNVAAPVPGSTIENTSWFGFRGRISRKEYWLHYALPLAMIQILVGIIDGLVRGNGILIGIAALVLIVPSIAGAVKRAHDRDRSGWFLLVCLIPFVGSIWYLVEIGFLRGTDGPNRFGRDPLQAALSYGIGPATA